MPADLAADLAHAREMLARSEAERCTIGRLLWRQRVCVLAEWAGEPEDIAPMVEPRAQVIA